MEPKTLKITVTPEAREQIRRLLIEDYREKQFWLQYNQQGNKPEDYDRALAEWRKENRPELLNWLASRNAPQGSNNENAKKLGAKALRV